MASCIAKIELENLTYTIPGGFNAAPYSTKLDLWELPRAQSFKGLWRWWLRVLLSGALWESEKLNEEKIRQISGNILGSTGQASKFIVHISAKGEAEPVEPQAIGEWKRLWRNRRLRRQLTTRPSALFTSLPTSPPIPSLPLRLFLLLQARETNERLAEKISCYPPGDLKIVIELLKRPFITVSPEECSIVVSSFLLSLILGGVGAIIRRGFGSLSFISVELHNDIQKYECIIDGIKRASEPNNIYNLLIKFIQESLSDARKLLGVKSSTSSSSIPDYPLLSIPGDPPRTLKPFNLNIFKLVIPNITSNEKRASQLLGFKDHEAMKLLTMIGYSATKLFWKLIDGKEFNVPGSPYETWVMGLPRGQKFDKRELQVPYFDIDLYEDSSHVGKVRLGTLKTGYSLDDKGDRRISAISIKPIKRLGKNSWIIAFYGFLSKDWYDELYHYGVTPPPKSKRKDYQVKRQRLVPSEGVSKAFVEAWIKLKKIYRVT
ncbi:MAG: type III-B CRISPR module RAMP protein Cmr1 [Candidatus Nezhaarchaeales archaeon]